MFGVIYVVLSSRMEVWDTLVTSLCSKSSTVSEILRDKFVNLLRSLCEFRRMSRNGRIGVNYDLPEEESVKFGAVNACRCE